MTRTDPSLLRVTTPDYAPHVRVVHLSRGKVNAISLDLKHEITRLFDALSDDGDVRAVVLTGNGRIFSAGADLKERAHVTSGNGAYLSQNRVTRETFNAIAECRKPVIAAIDGPAIGAGVGLAAAADFAVCVPQAYFHMPEVAVGMAGGAASMLKLFPPAYARYTYLLSKQIPAEDLLRFGVVVDVVEPEELLGRAVAMATEISTRSPQVIEDVKQIFEVVSGMDPRKAYRYEQGMTIRFSDRGEFAGARMTQTDEGRSQETPS